MLAVQIADYTKAVELPVVDLPIPEPTPGQVTLRVRAAGCGFVDALMVSGEYQFRPPLPFTPGCELAGEVVAVGDDVDGIAVGDRLLGFCGLRAYAQYALAPSGFLHRIPAGMSYAEAAAFPISYTTAYAALKIRGQLRAGEHLLVHGAAGSTGYSAVQVGKALGAQVIALASNEQKASIAKSAGADIVINTSTQDFVEEVRSLTGGRGADVVFDPVGGVMSDLSLKCIAWNGRLVAIGFASGVIPSLRTNRILLKNASVVGLNWAGYWQNEPEAMPPVFDALFEMYESGEIRPLIRGCHTLDQVGQAFETIRRREACGKLVVCPWIGNEA